MEIIKYLDPFWETSRQKQIIHIDAWYVAEYDNKNVYVIVNDYGCIAVTTEVWFVLEGRDCVIVG